MTVIDSLPPCQRMNPENYFVTNRKLNRTKPSSTEAALGPTFTEDILPSFEMHNHMFNRSINDVPLPFLLPPPEYNTEADPASSSTVTTPTGSVVDQDSLILNIVSNLQNLSLPVTIKLVITSSPPRFDIENPRASPLKQYKPGDTVHGYIVIENISDEIIPFEMFLVSLEGQETVASSSGSSHEARHFLNSFDLSACFHDGCILVGSSRSLTQRLQHDEKDDTYFGFNEERTLLPGVKHKKFFSFTIPKFLLDTACPHQIFHHLTTPPSFGFDNNITPSSLGSGTTKTLATATQSTRGLEFNEHLGYGRVDAIGSPVVTKDMHREGQSVSYYLRVRMIGLKDRLLDLERQSKFTNDEKAFVMKECKHYIQIDTSSENPIYQEIDSTHFPMKSTEDQLKYIEQLTKDELMSIMERKNLFDIGINDRFSQDLILDRNVSSSKKNSSVDSNNSLPLLNTNNSSAITTIDDLPKYHWNRSDNFKKDFFNRLDGDLNINLRMETEAQMVAITPKPMFNIIQKSCDDRTEMSISCIKPTKLGEVEVNLQLTPNSSGVNNTSISHLPKTINLTPNLKVFTIQSSKAIPVSFDSEYMCQPDSFLKLDNLSKKFKIYKNQMIHIGQEANIGLTKSVYDMADSLANLSRSVEIVKKLFKPDTLPLNWEKSGNSYVCKVKFQLEIDGKSANRFENQTLRIVPSFQTCHLTRGYLVDLELNVKGGQKHKVSLPLIVD